MQPPAYILDLFFESGSFNDISDTDEQPLWFNVHVDGLQNPFSTPQAKRSAEPKWNWPVRLLFYTADVNRNYMYLTLCSYEPHPPHRVTALARSRVGLRSLPIGNPRKFSVPLMDANNSARCIASVKISATLSSLGKQQGPPVVGGPTPYYSQPPNGYIPQMANPPVHYHSLP